MTKRIVGFLVVMCLLVGMMAGGSAEKLWDAADFKSDKPSSEWKLALVPQYGPASWWGTRATRAPNSLPRIPV